MNMIEKDSILHNAYLELLENNFYVIHWKTIHSILVTENNENTFKRK